MKKIIYLSIILLVVFLGIFWYLSSKDSTKSDLTKIKVAEVTHSPFYAPLYVAINNGYFEDEGLDIELILTPGADKVSAAVLSKDVEIGFCGPESTIYIYNENVKDYIVNFAGLTKKDGQFIVSRTKEDNFDIKNLNNKTTLVGRKGGMPALNFKEALDNNNVNNANLDYSVEFANLTSSFISGNGDYVNLFEPNATLLEKQGLGYIVGNVGSLANNVPYTAFNTLKSYQEKNTDTLIKFNNALNKGLAYVKENSYEDIATSIQKSFLDISYNDLVRIVKNYKDSDSWYIDTSIPEDDFKNLETMLIKNDLIKDYSDYSKLVINLNE